MKTSLPVKVLIALFLVAFVWFVFNSIQGSERPAPATDVDTLRGELLGRMENVTLNIGNLSITTELQETYKDGEQHFHNFEIKQETEGRDTTVTGRLAKVRYNGTDVELMEMEGNVHLVSSDGLDLHTPTLNYTAPNNRIFTQTPAQFALKNLEGGCDLFEYFTDTRRLELHGKVDVTFHPDREEAPAAGAPAQDGLRESAPADESGALDVQRRPTRARCKKLVYDQETHSVELRGNVRLEQNESRIRSELVLGTLSADNKRFITLRAETVEARVMDRLQDNGPEEPEAQPGEGGEGEWENPPVRLSSRAIGIKNLQSRELLASFAPEGRNVLQSVLARGEAALEIEPSQEQRDGGGAERKSLSGETIEATIGPDGQAVQNLRADGGEKDAVITITPLEGSREEKQAATKTITARRLSAEVDPETGDFTEVLMAGRIKLVQGDTSVTGENGRLDNKKNRLRIDGKPVLRDKAKLVEAEQMVVSLGIGDLLAEGGVKSTFAVDEGEEESSNLVFMIGDEAEETVISADVMNLDYRNNVLRYSSKGRTGGGVQALQGKSSIQSGSLDIYQEETRLIAVGEVKATLVVPKAVEEAAAGGRDDEAGKDGEKKKDRKAKETTTMRLTADRLEFDKKHGELRLNGNVDAREGDMRMACNQRLVYYFGSENEVRRAFAQGQVKVTIGPKLIAGDKADYFVAQQVLVVQGNVEFTESGVLQGTYRKLTLDIANDKIEFDARADQLLKTRVMTNE